MNGKRPAEPSPGRAGKKGKKEVIAEFSDAVTEETLKKQVSEAWSRRTPFRHGNWALWRGSCRPGSGSSPAIEPNPRTPEPRAAGPRDRRPWETA